MDLPVDGADPFIITTTEKPAIMAIPPVLIHACTNGHLDHNEEDQTPGLHRHGQHTVINSLRAKSDIWTDDIDVFFPCDGFLFITISWIENSGLCGPGEARAYIKQGQRGPRPPTPAYRRADTG